MKNNIILKRFIAYLIDFVIVAGIASCFSYLSILNPNRNLYERKYNEVLTLFEQYEQGGVTQEDYEQQYIPMYYDLNRLNVNYAIINLVVLIGYFGIFQWQFGGKTIGKKFMKIKVLQNKDNCKPGIVSFFIRTVVLNNVIITILQLIVLFVCNVNNYYVIYSNVNLVGYVLLYILVFLMFVRTDHRGLHDMIAGTKVVLDEVDEKKEEISETKMKDEDEKIPEAKFEEVKKEKVKKKSTKSKK